MAEKKRVKPKYCINVQTDNTKNRLHSMIEKNDVVALKKAMETQNISPYEELSKVDSYWTALHYACHFGSTDCLKYMIRKIFERHPNEFSIVMNEKTVEGYTPLIITAIYGRKEATKTLLQTGGIDLKAKSDDGYAAIDHAHKHKHPAIVKLVEDEILTNKTKSVTPVNCKFMIQEPTMKSSSNLPVEDRPEYQALFKFGIKYPCMFCMTNKGWIKYTTCCGQPLHEVCQKNITRCPNCKKDNLKLTCDMLYPERAFSLD
jgi:hypothetical protein